MGSFMTSKGAGGGEGVRQEQPRLACQEMMEPRGTSRGLSPSRLATNSQICSMPSQSRQMKSQSQVAGPQAGQAPSQCFPVPLLSNPPLGSHFS